MAARGRTSSGERSLIMLAIMLFVLWNGAPLAWLVISSLMQQQALTSTPPDFSPSSFTITNYVEVFGAAAQLGRGLFNSLFVAFRTTAIAILIGAPAAYALARLALPARNTMLLTILAAQMFPGSRDRHPALHGGEPSRPDR